MSDSPNAEVIVVSADTVGGAEVGHAGSGPELARIGEALRGGEIVAIPTETVYGLACNALDPDAVQRVFDAKERPASDPLIVHVDGIDMLDRVVDGGLPELAMRLAEQFWPGPLTMIVPRHPDLPAAVTSGLPDVAVRCPAHPVASAIITAAGVPLAAPSANRFSRVSPTSAQHVFDDLGDRIDLIVDGGRCEHGLESTVVAFDDGVAVVLRHGAVPLEAINEVVSARMLDAHAGKSQAKASPGHDERHYSPRTPAIAVVPGLLASLETAQMAALGDRRVRYASYEGRDAPTPTGWQPFDLGPSGSLDRVAHDLYDSLRRMDTDDVELLVLELTGAAELGRAIDDRLSRAASSRVVGDPAELLVLVEGATTPAD